MNFFPAWLIPRRNCASRGFFFEEANLEGNKVAAEEEVSTENQIQEKIDDDKDLLEEANFKMTEKPKTSQRRTPSQW